MRERSKWLEDAIDKVIKREKRPLPPATMYLGAGNYAQAKLAEAEGASISEIQLCCSGMAWEKVKAMREKPKSDETKEGDSAPKDEAPKS